MVFCLIFYSPNDAQFKPHAPPQHPPPDSQEDPDERSELDLLANDMDGADISRLWFEEPQ